MSWDFYMEADLGGPHMVEVKEGLNYTYNVAPMYNKAIEGGIRKLEGKKGKECIPILKKCIENMKADPVGYRALNPSNGWGDYEGALSVAENLLQWCEECPEAVMGIC